MNGEREAPTADPSARRSRKVVSDYPSSLWLSVPAADRSLGLVRDVTARIGEEAELPGDRVDDLRLAADELASVVIEGARPAANLEVSVGYDDDDLYLRMWAPVSSDGFDPKTPELTKLLLVATVDSFEVGNDGELIVGVLQTRRRPRDD